ncbi:MAG: hypothetical protein D6701_03710, partial [Gemmatimonadetes bacterium]
MKGEKPHFFRIDAHAVEEVTFGREADGKGDYYDVVLSANALDQPAEPDPSEREWTPVSVMNMAIDGEFDGRGSLRATATAHMTTNVPGGWWVPFGLYEKLELDSLVWADGTP